jgi:2-polyprenyl-6-methoxyphenol hydroxylase-like FAD-dependent oxidoreductase
VIVRGRWARTLFDYYEDPTQLGLLTAITLKAQGYDIMILSSYWPILAAKTDNDQLWNKAIRALRPLGIQTSPLEYAKTLIHKNCSNTASTHETSRS